MYKLPELSYSFDDLEPFIDTHTMGVHYHKHHQNYLNQLNKILQKYNYDYRYNTSELIFHINEFPSDEKEDYCSILDGQLEVLFQ